LVTAREYGLERLEILAAREAAAGSLGPGGEATPAALEHYFRHSLRYRLGSEEMAGVRRFRELCVAHRLVEAEAGLIVFGRDS
jgi:predicted solute-binding protein